MTSIGPEPGRLRSIPEILADREEVLRRLDAANQATTRARELGDIAAAEAWVRDSAEAESDLRRLIDELAALQQAAMARCDRDLQRLRRSYRTGIADPTGR